MGLENMQLDLIIINSGMSVVIIRFAFLHWKEEAMKKYLSGARPSTFFFLLFSSLPLIYMFFMLVDVIIVIALWHFLFSFFVRNPLSLK